MSTVALWRNPFATTFIRPGAIPFNWEWLNRDAVQPRSFAELTVHWQRHQQRGAIIAPHGAGKSTLLCSWINWLQEYGHAVLHLTLHVGQRTLPEWNWSPNVILLIDGYEQLSIWSKFRLWQRIQRTNQPLIVTAHDETCYATLLKFEPSYTQFCHVARACMATVTNVELPEQQLQECWQTAGKNLREGLFLLYDWAERELATAANST
jgi:hypothetical protein